MKRGILVAMPPVARIPHFTVYGCAAIVEDRL